MEINVCENMEISWSKWSFGAFSLLIDSTFEHLLQSDLHSEVTMLAGCWSIRTWTTQKEELQGIQHNLMLDCDKCFTEETASCCFALV